MVGTLRKIKNKILYRIPWSREEDFIWTEAHDRESKREYVEEFLVQFPELKIHGDKLCLETRETWMDWKMDQIFNRPLLANRKD